MTSKRHIDNTPDGNNQLFQTPEEFLPGTLWVTETDGLGNDTIRFPNELGGGYYQLTPAPAAGTKLFIQYDVAQGEETAVLTEWESKRLNELLGTIKALSEAQRNMDASLLKRVTHKDFDSWASAVDRKLRDFQSLIGK